MKDATIICYCISFVFFIVLTILSIYIIGIYMSIKEKYKVDNVCYDENGEITNVCAMIALKTIKREHKNNLSEIEKDAIEKGIKSIMALEKVYDFIENNEK